MQLTTRRFLPSILPGHVYTQPGAPGNEFESLMSPFVLQELEVVIAGADPFAAPADFELTLPAQDGSGTITVTVTIPAATTLADAIDLIQAAFAANGAANTLYASVSDSVDTMTLVSRSGLLSIAAASFTATFTDAHTATVTQTVAAAAPSLAMGLWYVYSSMPPVGPALTGSSRGCRIAALPDAATTIEQLRGVISRVENQTTMSLVNNPNTVDAYPAGQVWPGLLRGRVAVRVAPQSTAMTFGSQVHVVKAAGAFSVIGSVAAVADGGNTLRIDNAPAGNILAMVDGPEETLSLFGGTNRYVPLKINRTN